MNKDVLTVNNLSVTLANNKIIKNLTFDVKEQDVLVVLGPNGAGKTTLLRALLGLVPYTGTINWHKKKIRYLPPQELINKKTLLPLSVQEFLNFKNISPTKIKTILRDVGLAPSVLTQQLEKLSTGQFQRLLIAWALIDKPEVLLFDEPTAGIDIGGEETIYSLLHKVWEKHKLTIILVTHHVHVVWEHATNILCMNKKKCCATENLKRY
ncbi:metal ABC transporter ATP-binding protein [Candidatus Dependentiae bacterium]